ncbi:MAG TPA: family 20 glycosylhydrolase [Gemmatimonadales bacterium]|nr:family 20 glycosylhydrolase [Gemmatimonadales bacterium]
MPDKRLAALPALLLALVAGPASAQSALQLRWQLDKDVFRGDSSGSSAVFTLTNRGAKPLAASGWAIYFSALHGAQPGSVGGGFTIEDVTGDLHRLVPGSGFAGLGPGASIRIPYVTWGFLLNQSFVPKGPYLVFDSTAGKGQVIADFAAAPFDRPPQGDGQDPRVISPQRQFALDSATRDIPTSELPPIFPTPLQVTLGAGTLRLTALPQVRAAAGLENEAGFAADYLRPYFKAGRRGTTTLQLSVAAVAGQSSPEAYELLVDSTGIRIVGVSSAGVFYGLQSLRSLLPAPSSRGDLVLPTIHVVDAPRFGYRGFMLDVARNFQPKSSVLRVLDLLARYKLNVFHMHLTDDEAWRVEIPSIPELTAFGARRGHTLDFSHFMPPAYGSGPDTGRAFGTGFFSRADYIEILRYAAARHIEVIPEIEMPGHARAAVKAMQARTRATGDRQYLLSDSADTSKYTTPQEYHDNIMNPALESTYRFITTVVGDLVAMHKDAGAPLRHIHMGGDEVPTGVWQGSPAVQAYLQANGLTSVDDLWYVFYGRVEQILKTHGLEPSGWEEIAVRRTRRDTQPVNIPNPDFATRGWRAYVWNNVPGWGGEDLAYRLANGGYDVVLCPVTNLYFDLAWNQNPEETGLDWGGYVDVRKPFLYIPYDYYRNTRVDRSGNPLDSTVFIGKDRLTDYGKSHVLGIQGDLWSETLSSPDRLEYMMVPKLLGLAERAWAPDPDWVRERDAARAAALFADAWSRFVNVVGKRELPRLDREVAGISYRIPTPGLAAQGGAVRATVELPGFTLRYTTDGSEPTAKSAVVSGPIPLKGTIRVAAFTTTGRKGHSAVIAAP